MRLRCEACLSLQFLLFDRLQNSPYFCVFKYARAVKQKVWNEVENRERDWGETLFLSLHTPYGGVRIARFARVRLSRHALPIPLLILRKKRLFCSLHCSTLFIRQCDQMCVFMGNLSSKTLKYHISLMTYDLKFLLL